MHIITDQIAGLTVALKNERSLLERHVEIKGLKTAVAASRTELNEKQDTLDGIKERLSGLKQSKRNALSETMRAIGVEMSLFLVGKKVALEIEDGGDLLLGLYHTDSEGDTYIKPSMALSGGERVDFDAALANALLQNKHKVIIIEGAESDHLESVMDSLHPQDEMMVIVNTCHPIDYSAYDSDRWNTLVLPE